MQPPVKADLNVNSDISNSCNCACPIKVRKKKKNHHQQHHVHVTVDQKTNQVGIDIISKDSPNTPEYG